MSLVRGHHKHDSEFTQIPNAWLRDERLSLGAKGLLAQILSHRPGWRITLATLARDNGIGRDGLRTLMNELLMAGYISRSDERERNSKGQLAAFTYVTKDPDNNQADTAEPELDSPTLAQPTLAQPTLDNPHHKKNIDKEENIKEENINNHAQKTFEAFWDAYPKKVSKGQARKAWAKALTKAKPEAIIAKAEAYAKDPDRDDQFTKYPATWLNAEGWLDEYRVSANELAERRRQKEVEWTRQYLESEVKEYTPPPQCEHGINPARCKTCLKRLK